jgi:uncharacterized membrane protein
MTFANPLPWWALALVAAAAAGLAALAYRGMSGARHRRATLAAIRFLTLLVLVVLLMRPVARVDDTETRDAVVPILVDVSRSMGIEDANGQRRIDRARDLLERDILPSLNGRFNVEVLSFGDGLAPAKADDLAPTARRSDLAGALVAVRERYRGRPVAGVVLLSDGGDTGGAIDEAAADTAVFALGVGSETVGRDREVLSVTAAEAVLDDSRVDLAVSAVSHGNGTAPIELRLLENGRPIEVRRAAPAAEGAPVHEVFHVAPGRGAPTVYTVEIPAAAGELVPENNTRSVLVQPPSRARRVLLVQGAPGFEHSFLSRALAADPQIEVDSVVRKGTNEQGADTFYIQASRARADALRTGFPATVEQLFAYDAIVLANIEANQLTPAQLESIRRFVGDRGGGLLIMGARSFGSRKLQSTPVEDVVPLDMSDRGGVVAASVSSRGANRVSLTTAGEMHPVMQLGSTLEETRKRWEQVPALASTFELGGPRAGATVLAASGGTGATSRALVAVQRFGDGRAMVFTGEAAWRWRMMLPSTDKSYDRFWRQAVRWLALPATDPVHMVVPAGVGPGEPVTLRVAARTGAFESQRDAVVDLRVTSPDGRLEQLRAAAGHSGEGSAPFAAQFQPREAGVYRVVADARTGAGAVGSSAAAVLVGGVDPEMTDPRLNLQVLQRVAMGSGGKLIGDRDTGQLATVLRARVPAAMLSVRRDLWHNGWSFAAIAILLGAEWVLRRTWGLR